MSVRRWLVLAGLAAGGAAVARKRAAGDGVDKSKLAPTPSKMLPYVGALPEIRKDNALTFLRGYQEIGDVVRYPVGLFDIYCLAHPDDVQQVLQADHKNWIHPPFLNRKLGEIVGHGLTTIEGEQWRKIRRLSQQAFHRQVLQDYVDLFTDTTAEMLGTWERLVRSGEYVDMRLELVNITLNNLARALFGADWSAHVHEMEPAVTIANLHADRRLLTAIDLPLWMPFPKYREFLQARDKINEIIYGTIRERRAAPDSAEATDLTSLLIRAVDEETGEKMTDEEVRDQVMTFMMAGHETVSAGMSWVWYLLSVNPQATERVIEEIDSVLGDRAPGVEDLPKLTFIQQVIDETLRLYPPLFVQPRTPAGGPRVPRLHDPCQGQPVRRAVPVRHAPPPRLLGQPGGLRPRPLHAREDQGAPPLRLLPVRRRPAQVHRRPVRPRADEDHGRDDPAALPARPRPGLPGAAAAGDLAAAAPRPAHERAGARAGEGSGMKTQLTLGKLWGATWPLILLALCRQRPDRRHRAAVGERAARRVGVAGLPDAAAGLDLPRAGQRLRLLHVLPQAERRVAAAVHRHRLGDHRGVHRAGDPGLHRRRRPRRPRRARSPCCW